MPVTSGGDTHRSAGLSGPQSRSRHSPCLIGAILGQDGCSGRRPRAAIREHPGPRGRCQVPPRRTTHPAHQDMRLLTSCQSTVVFVSWLYGRTTGRGDAGPRAHLGPATCHPNARSGTHAHMQVGYMHEHAHRTRQVSQAGAQRGQAAPTARQTKLDMGPSFTRRDRGAQHLCGAVQWWCREEKPSRRQSTAHRSKLCPTLFGEPSLSLAPGQPARGHGDGWTWNVESKVRLKMG